jgi:hypothetical protein
MVRNLGAGVAASTNVGGGVGKYLTTRKTGSSEAAGNATVVDVVLSI